jgi:hypothetical protein
MLPSTSTMSIPVGAASRAERNSSLARRRSVSSRVILLNPMSAPSALRIAPITTLAQKREPSFRTRQPSSSSQPSRAAEARLLAGFPVAMSSCV